MHDKQTNEVKLLWPKLIFLKFEFIWVFTLFKSEGLNALYSQKTAYNLSICEYIYRKDGRHHSAQILRTFRICTYCTCTVAKDQLVFIVQSRSYTSPSLLLLLSEYCFLSFWWRYYCLIITEGGCYRSIHFYSFAYYNWYGWIHQAVVAI